MGHVDEIFKDKICAFDSSGGLVISGGGNIDIPLDSEHVKTAGILHTSPWIEFTVVNAGVYAVWGSFSSGITTGTSRSESYAWLMRDPGTGYTKVFGTDMYLYNRTSNQGKATPGFNVILSLNAGDKLKLQATRLSGTSTIATVADATSLNILRV